MTVSNKPSAPQHKNIWYLLIMCIMCSIAFSEADTLSPSPAAADTSSAATATDSLAADYSALHDSAMAQAPDTSVNDSGKTAAADSSPIQKPDQTAAAAEDTTILRTGPYLSAGFGWSLGGFALTDFWKNALPDSLAHFGLTEKSFRAEIDSNSTATVLYSDTARLKCVVKEQPAIYTMSFPVSVSFVNITGDRRMSASLTGSWMRKVYTTSIMLVDDTGSAKCDYKESINVYSLFLSMAYGCEIPLEYFSIDGIEKCFFVCGLDVSPLIATSINKKTSAPSNNSRLQQIQKHIAAADRFFNGGAASLRVGLSMIKRINKNNATDAGFYYTIQGYGYFWEDGNRVRFNDIDDAHKKERHPLYWISNRFELSIALLRHCGK